MVVVLIAIRKITVTKHYSDVSSLNIPLIQPINNDKCKVIGKRAKKMWFLAYTLVRNPDLIELRRRDSVTVNNTMDSDVSPSNLV